jgi:hypothetical protein
MELVYTQQQQQQIKEEETKFLPATIQGNNSHPHFY